jgi:hypothetical protein
VCVEGVCLEEGIIKEFYMKKAFFVLLFVLLATAVQFNQLISVLEAIKDVLYVELSTIANGIVVHK